MKKSALPLLLTILALVSCKRDLDFNKYDNAEYEYDANWVLPVFKAFLNLGDLADKQNLLQSDPDGFLRIVYRRDSLFIYALDDYFTLPEQDTVNLNIVQAVTSQVDWDDLEQLHGGLLDAVTFSEGNLYWETQPASASYVMEVTLIGASLNGQPVSFEINCGANQKCTGNENIDGISFDLTQGPNGKNEIGFESRFIQSNLPANEEVNLKIWLTQLRVGAVAGYLGNYEIDIPEQELSFDLAGFKNFFEGLYLENPIATFEYITNVGLPLELRPDLEGRNKAGAMQNINFPPVMVSGAPNPGVWDTTYYTVNRNNSNIVNFIQILPEVLISKGKVEVNPSGQPSNFLNSEASAIFNLEMQLPLELRMQNMRFEQIVEDVDLGLGETENPLEKLVMHFRVRNGFPMGADLRLVFFDSITDIATDSVMVPLLDAATVNAQGRVTQPKTSRYSVSLEREQIESLIATRKIRVSAILNTTNMGQTIVKFYTDYGIEVAFGLEAEFNIKIQ